MASKSLLVGILIGGCASAGMLLVGCLLFGWQLGPIDEYALTEGLVNLLGVLPVLVGGAILLSLIPFNAVAYLASLIVLPAPFLIAIVYEGTKFQSSHNLLPFELGMWAMFSILLHLPSAAGHMVYTGIKSHRAQRQPVQGT